MSSDIHIPSVYCGREISLQISPNANRLFLLLRSLTQPKFSRKFFHYFLVFRLTSQTDRQTESESDRDRERQTNKPANIHDLAGGAKYVTVLREVVHSTSCMFKLNIRQGNRQNSDNVHQRTCSQLIQQAIVGYLILQNSIIVDTATGRSIAVMTQLYLH